MSWTWTFESGSNGDPATTANTGADSLFTTGGTAVISTAQAFAGTRSLLMTATTANGILALVRNLNSGDTQLVVDLYLYWTALPSAEVTLVRVLDNSNATCFTINADGSGHLRYRDAAGTQQAISGSGSQSMSTGQWSHVKVTATPGTSTGTMQIQYFVGSSGTASYDSGTLTGQNNGTNWNACRVGIKASTLNATATAYLDAVTGTETGGTSSTYSQTVNDSVGVSDTPTPQTIDWSTTVTDSVGVSDTPTVFDDVSPDGGLLFTATADPTNYPPRVLLNVAGAPGTQVTITRTDAAGNTQNVRAADPAPLTVGGWVGFDYEAPYNQPVTYSAVTDAEPAAAVTASVTLPVAQPWLLHPGIPALSVPVELAAAPDLASDVNAGVMRPLGRSTAVVITDGQRQAPTLTIDMWTRTQADEDALWALLDDTSTLLLQVVYPGTSRALYRWVSVGQVTRSPLVPVWANDLHRWSLPCTVSSRPSGLLQSQRTWADTVAENATWADVLTEYADWRDEITGTPIGS